MTPAARQRRNRAYLAAFAVVVALWTCAAVLIPAMSPP